MEKHYTLLIFLSLAFVAHCNNTNLFHHAMQKVTHLQFYIQDVLSGPNPSNIVVASANSTYKSPTFFGLTAVLDDPITTRPDPNGYIVGRAQGFFAFASSEEIILHMSFDIVFTSGKYNGSVLNIVGRNPYLRDHRELSVVGGSGAFRLARGFFGVRTVSSNNSTGDAFFEYNVTVFLY